MYWGWEEFIWPCNDSEGIIIFLQLWLCPGFLLLAAVECFLSHLWEFDFLLLCTADVYSRWTIIYSFSSWEGPHSLFPPLPACPLLLTEPLSPLKLCHIVCGPLGLHCTLPLSSAAVGSPSPATKGPVAGPLTLHSICVMWEWERFRSLYYIYHIIPLFK